MPVILQDACDENIIRSGPAPAPCSKTRGRWILAATILASSMAFIDGTVVNVALPALQTNLNATAADVQWVIESYALLLSGLLLVGGSLGDHYGRRRVFVLGVVIFAVASGLCGFAGSIRQLIAARAVQGFGAALLVPGSLAIISNSFSERERGRAIGVWSGFSAITTGIGPVLGGWLIQHVSWRAVFFINLPLAFVVVLISLRHIGENSDKETTRVDWLGAILAALGLGALVYGLIESSQVGFNDRSVIVTLAVGIVVLILFLFVESRLSQPMLPLTLFRSRTFAGTNLLTFLLYAALGGTLFFLPLNLIQVQHYSPTAAGAVLLPFILIISLLSRWSGGLVARYGPKIPLIVGPLITAVGYLLFLLPGIGGSYWTNFLPPVVVLGLGMAVTVAPLTTTVMNSIAQNRAGIASGVNNAVARTASLVAIAVLGVVMIYAFKSNLDHRLSSANMSAPVAQSLQTQSIKLAATDIPENVNRETHQLIRRAIDESFVSGFRLVMVIGAALAAGSAVTALFWIGGAPAARSVEKRSPGGR
ncbi:MAG TPA: MFS transporter [Candidatus Tectomicrobia bacterium]|nr:MFS transporter [Candidatus Tectomicrobia bacterium]